MKKNILLLFTIMLLFNLTVFAGGVGYINYNKVVENYNFAKIMVQEFDMKAQELQKYLKEKEEEYKQLESPVQKQKFEQEMKNEVQKRETAFNDFQAKREQVIKLRIQSVIDKIRTQKDLDVILGNENIYSGGVDITEDVIQELNK